MFPCFEEKRLEVQGTLVLNLTQHEFGKYSVYEYILDPARKFCNRWHARRVRQNSDASLNWSGGFSEDTQKTVFYSFRDNAVTVGVRAHYLQGFFLKKECLN